MVVVEWRVVAESRLLHCNIVVQRTDPAQKAANAKTDPKEPFGFVKIDSALMWL